MADRVGVDDLLASIRACAACADHLAAGPRPIVQFSQTSRLVIVGQAPGARVHASGIPWDDASGDRMREWTGLSKPEFYDPARVALVPMGFCFPGSRAGGDLPPRPECAQLWHDRVMGLLPQDRLVLLVGSYAQAQYLGKNRRASLTETVRDFEAYGPDLFPLPHPSWRSGGWMQRNPWFQAQVLPALRARMAGIGFSG